MKKILNEKEIVLYFVVDLLFFFIQNKFINFTKQM